MSMPSATRPAASCWITSCSINQTAVRSRRTSANSPNGAVAPVDQDRICAAVREILLAVGEDPDREGLIETPERVARMYAELFAGNVLTMADSRLFDGGIVVAMIACFSGESPQLSFASSSVCPL